MCRTFLNSITKIFDLPSWLQQIPSTGIDRIYTADGSAASAGGCAKARLGCGDPLQGQSGCPGIEKITEPALEVDQSHSALAHGYGGREGMGC